MYTFYPLVEFDVENIYFFFATPPNNFFDIFKLLFLQKDFSDWIDMNQKEKTAPPQRLRAVSYATPATWTPWDLCDIRHPFVRPFCNQPKSPLHAESTLANLGLSEEPPSRLRTLSTPVPRYVPSTPMFTLDDSCNNRTSITNMYVCNQQRGPYYPTYEFAQTKFESEDSAQEEDKVVQISNLDPSVLESELVECAFLASKVKPKVRMCLDTKCAFLFFECEQAAARARPALKKFENSKKLKHSTQSRALWVGNLPPNYTVQQLSAQFSSFGNIESCRILTHKSCGFVNYTNDDDSVEAKRMMHGHLISGNQIRVGFAKVPTSPPKQPSGVDVNTTLLTNINGTLVPGVMLPYSEHHQQNEKLQNFECLVDQERIKKLKLLFEQSTMEMFFMETKQELVNLCLDGFGNTIVQKFIEKSSEELRLQIIQVLSPSLPALSVHKHGTWVVQKIVMMASSQSQHHALVEPLRSYAESLLLDPYGNYVMQCCLKMGSPANQFIYDILSQRCVSLSHSKFGSKAMCACLNHENCTNLQKSQVAASILKNATQLACNMHGQVLITWLLEDSGIQNSLQMLKQALLQDWMTLALHKNAQTLLLKVFDQNEKPLLDLLFLKRNLTQVMMDGNGRVFLKKIMNIVPESQKAHYYGLIYLIK